MPYTKEEKNEYNRLWRIKNKSYHRSYSLKNKEQIKEQQRLYRQNENKQEKKEYHRLYRLENEEKMKQQMWEWSQTEQGIKSRTISSWRRQGILCFDFDLLYDIFLSTTNCEFCQVELTTGRYMTSTTKCLDHDHSINDMFNVRGVLCTSCNIKDVLK
tara:strand:+ start:20 stop:493 length:474 start_codon:yes stop_codon:yes gene_type:complete